MFRTHPVRPVTLAAAGTLALTMLAATLVSPPAASASSATAQSGAVTAASAGQWSAVDLTGVLNSNGIGNRPGEANFDGGSYSFPAELPSGPVTVDGVPFVMPPAGADGVNDNIVPRGQTIDLPDGRYFSIELLTASGYGPANVNVTVNYTDGTSRPANFASPDWYSAMDQVSVPFRFTPTSIDHHVVSVFPASIGVDDNRTVSSITLPDLGVPTPGSPNAHIFAMTMLPATPGATAMIRSARSTTTRMDARGTKAQSVEVTVMNVGQEWLDDTAHVVVKADGVKTVVPASVKKLGPGESARVRVGIVSPGVPKGRQVDATVQLLRGQRVIDASQTPIVAGIPAYTSANESLASHQSPEWFRSAKFGIFIHWGPYSVPAWAPVGQQYAEWYWKQMNDVGSPTYDHHRETYGAEVAYDDFIPRFKAEKYDPAQWVKLFKSAGAQYWVLTSKHHDGFSLYDSAYTKRDAVDMGPGKDLVRQLFDASRQYTPKLHTGLYYSLPEWYNPDEPWFGHAPQNPYTGAAEPYTGYDSVGNGNYVQKYQALQMKEIITKYRPEVLWCDIGSPATDPSVLVDYFNQALALDQEVTVNNRCGQQSSDFPTPEYSRSYALSTRHFEASRGIDPFSYGYNSATPDSAYATADQLIDELMDIVSKNGNLLLDIGPRADGTIPEIMQTRLREIGDWLKANGEAVFDSTYWSRGASEGDLRFTVQQDKAFYITSLSHPGDQLVVTSSVPIRPGDKVTMLGYDGELNWRKNDAGELIIDVPAAAADAGSNAWVFKIDWQD
jgi:alpha-L-fucosidase